MDRVAKRVWTSTFSLIPTIIILQLLGFQGVVRGIPSDIPGFEAAITQYRQSNQSDQILSLCNDLLSTVNDNPFRLRILQAMAECYIETSRQQEATDTIARIHNEHASTAGIAKALCEVGDAYQRIKDLSSAQAIYEDLVAQFGTDPYSMWAQKNLCEMFAKQGKIAETEQAIAKLTAQFSGHSEYAKALCDAADACFRAKRYDRALELYEYLVANHSGVEHIIWAQKNRCLILVEQNSAEFEAQLSKLETTFQYNPFLGQALNEVGDALHAAQNMGRAKQIFQQVVSHYPLSKPALWASQKLIVLAIEESEKTNTSPTVPAEILSAIDSMIAGYPGFDDLAPAVFMAGETYYNLALADCRCKPKPGNEDRLLKSIAVWKKIIDGNLPHHPSCTPHAWFFTAVCYTYLKDDVTGIPYLLKVINTWPDYEYGWSTQSWLGDAYVRLKNTHKLPPSDGNQLATAAYIRLLEKFPSCPKAYAACWELGQLGFEEGRWDQAVDFYGQFIQSGKTDPRIPKAYYRLGLSFENLGQPENAQQIYEIALAQLGEGHSLAPRLHERLNALKGGAQ